MVFAFLFVWCALFAEIEPVFNFTNCWNRCCCVFGRRKRHKSSRCFCLKMFVCLQLCFITFFISHHHVKISFGVKIPGSTKIRCLSLCLIINSLSLVLGPEKMTVRSILRLNVNAGQFQARTRHFPHSRSNMHHKSFLHTPHGASLSFTLPNTTPPPLCLTRRHTLDRVHPHNSPMCCSLP